MWLAQDHTSSKNQQLGFEIHVYINRDAATQNTNLFFSPLQITVSYIHIYISALSLWDKSGFQLKWTATCVYSSMQPRTRWDRLYVASFLRLPFLNKLSLHIPAWSAFLWAGSRGSSRRGPPLWNTIPLVLLRAQWADLPGTMKDSSFWFIFPR